MGWKQDRDLLIAETLAFVKAVKGAHADAPEPLQIVPLEQIKQILKPETASDRSETPGDLAPPKFERTSSLSPGNERDEIASRLASFKATQLKFQREREQFGSATLTDALNAAGAPRPSNVRSNQPE
jgi:hypothetical protein